MSLLALATVSSLLVPLPSQADPPATPPPTPRAEILALIGVVEQSGCSFGRNGRWHSPTDARRLLQHKFEARHPGGDFVSAEQFIDLAATRSSFSGQLYVVRCGADGPVVEARPWLHDRLRVLRQARKPTAGADKH